MPLGNLPSGTTAPPKPPARVFNPGPWIFRPIRRKATLCGITAFFCGMRDGSPQQYSNFKRPAMVLNNFWQPSPRLILTMKASPKTKRRYPTESGFSAFFDWFEATPNLARKLSGLDHIPHSAFPTPHSNRRHYPTESDGNRTNATNGSYLSFGLR